MADASHLIGKRGEPITASRSAPQAAGPFFSILDEFESERKKQSSGVKKKKSKKKGESEIIQKNKRGRVNANTRIGIDCGERH